MTTSAIKSSRLRIGSSGLANESGPQVGDAAEQVFSVGQRVGQVRRRARAVQRSTADSLDRSAESHDRITKLHKKAGKHSPRGDEYREPTPHHRTFHRGLERVVARRMSSEASLGPPRWVAGLCAFVAVGLWLRSGPSLPSRSLPAPPPGWVLVRIGLTEQAGGHGCGSNGQRCA